MNTNSIRQFGLIGKNIGHSFSPTYFAAKFKAEDIQDAYYGLYDLSDITQFEDLAQKANLVGLNVTIPYKQEIIPYLDELDPIAKDIGAVNTIHFYRGKKIGYNTDIIGCMDSLKALIGRRKVDDALILGTGGASKSVQYALHSLGISYTIVSRTKGDLTYDQVDKKIIQKNRLIVNTTPLGMQPNIDTCPDIPYHALNKKHLLFDLVYNPKNTLFLNHGLSQSCRVLNGESMLVKQAEAAWKIWNKL